LVRYASLNFFGLLLLLSLLLTGCESEEPSADFILQKSLEAHGGIERWKKMKCIRYLKTTTFYDPTGVIEKKSVQHITHQWRPKQMEMIWENEGKSYRALKDTTGILLYKEGILQKDSLLLAQADTNLKAALYVYWQPFKLLEGKAQKNYLGIQKLLDSISVHAVQIRYSEEKNADVWTYFFDTQNYRLCAAQVLHYKRISLIVNEAVESETGLFLNHKRKSYFLDSVGKIKHLRAAYSYEIDSFTTD
jgi:hypothetical protein